MWGSEGGAAAAAVAVAVAVAVDGTAVEEGLKPEEEQVDVPEAIKEIGAEAAPIQASVGFIIVILLCTSSCVLFVPVFDALPLRPPPPPIYGCNNTNFRRNRHTATPSAGAGPEEAQAGAPLLPDRPGGKDDKAGHVGRGGDRILALTARRARGGGG